MALRTNERNWRSGRAACAGFVIDAVEQCAWIRSVPLVCNAKG
jgi:hypothetical protein